MINLFFDLLLAGLLVAAIVFCWRLNGRLKTMRQMGAELSPFMKNMTSYLGQISQSIDKLKQVADLGNQGLNEHIPVAISLKDDFDILLEYSDKMARRLDEVIEKAREIDQRLQKTIHMADAARAHDRRVESALQRPIDKGQRGDSVFQEPYTKKDRYKDERADSTSQPFPIPPLEFDKDGMDFFVPNQLKQMDSNVQNTERKSETSRKQSQPIERGIMAKLRGLR
ncbi:MAG: hypothetical protein NWS47_04205 [Alphaproteobacteria bacterium]|nr:hypothetical protein [Alphaproteobacteria bacterium]